MKARRKRDERIGKLLFILPVLVIVGIGTYAFISLNQPGTLSIITYSHDKYTETVLGPSIRAPVSVVSSSATNNYTAPASLSLRPGSYSVVYGRVNGYYTPSEKTVLVGAGSTVYANAVYEVVPMIISCSAQGFNNTQVPAVHGVTPVIWVNTGSDTFVLLGQPFGREVLNVGQNFTYVYSSSGNYQFANLDQTYNGTVSVG